MSEATQFRDAKIVSGYLVAAIEGPDVNRVAPKRQSCIAVFCAQGYEWLAEDAIASMPIELSDDGRALHWPEANRTISVDEVLQPFIATFYFLKWNLKSIREPEDVSMVVGCWKTPAGYTLLKNDGSAHIKLVGRGTADDLDGDWKWKRTGDRKFCLFPSDQKNFPLAVPTDMELSRFDGKILELRTAATSEGIGTVEGVVLWKTSKRPKSWESV